MSGALRATIGCSLWLGGMVVIHPIPFDVAWAHGLLMLAPLVLVPLGLDLVAAGETCRPCRTAAVLQLPAAVLLGLAYLVPQGAAAASLALPWLATTLLIAWCGLVRVLRRRELRPLPDLCSDAGLLLVAVGGAWVVADRLGFRPLEFEPVIVLLTAIHFHFAGFILPIVTGLAARETPGWIARLAAVAVISGVPAVAVGITTTQLRLGTWCECVAAWWLALGGIAAAVLHLRLALRPGATAAIRVLWALAGVSLLASMVLAALYGARSWAEVSWLDIPWMRALHGTSNAIGFGLACTLGWYGARRLRHAEQAARSLERR